MKLPRSLLLLAQYFHQDALEGNRTVENILCEFTFKHGEKHIREIQRFMATSLANEDAETMEEQWEQADSAIDFERDTPQFFQRVVDFDPAPCVRSS